MIEQDKVNRARLIGSAIGIVAVIAVVLWRLVAR